jgi:hypothetical protein
LNLEVIRPFSKLIVQATTSISNSASTGAETSRYGRFFPLYVLRRLARRYANISSLNRLLLSLITFEILLSFSSASESELSLYYYCYYFCFSSYFLLSSCQLKLIQTLKDSELYLLLFKQNP